MAAKAPQFAKLTRPRLHKAVARERLFNQLDEARSRKSAICVIGPPGAGKTTLVASWLDENDIKGIWYQVDPGDADLATFFYYLGEAAKPFRRKNQRLLPLLTPEYLQDVGGFSRRFFRELFSRLPDGATLVLDNYQEVESSHSFHEIVSAAVNEIPQRRTLLAVSRRDPPDCYARLIANGNVDFVEWDELRLTLEEARQIVETRVSAVELHEVNRLYEDCGGWAAGLTLMLDSYRQGEGGSRFPEKSDVMAQHDSIFGYFAAQVFESLPDRTRDFLLATAVLPQVPVSLARELTGDPGAADILEDLYRRHLFTHRRAGAEPTYWYHALFREFLKARSLAVVDQNRMRETMRRAARLLEARSDFDDAFRLFFDAGDWPAARRLIERHAEAMLAHGRGGVLRDWILTLPDGIVEDAPWLRYWLGTSLIEIEQKQARSHLERAFGRFATSIDNVGQALSAAGVIESYFFEWSDFRPLRHWVDTLEPLLKRTRMSVSALIERRIYNSLLLGMLYAAPDHRLLPHVVERLTEMLDEDMDINSKVSIAHTLLSYGNISCDMERGTIAVARTELLLDHPELTPFNRVWWYVRKGYYCFVTGEYGAGFEALNRASELSEEHGLQGLRRAALLVNSYQNAGCAMIGDVRRARMWHERNSSIASPDRPMDKWHVTETRVHLECANGNYGAVAEYSRKAAAEAADVGMPYIEILGVEHEAAGLAVTGDLQRLDETLSRLRRMISGTCFAFLECQARFLESYSALVHGSAERGRGLLKEAMRFAREHQFRYAQMARYSVVTGYLFAEALREGVEAEYVCDVIRRLRIRPPVDAPDSWPWPIRIHSLGRFDVFRDGEKLEFRGRAPRKVLALLREIVAGGGEAVASSHLVDTLWGDEEGDAGRKALDVSLVRLRKLLGSTDAVIVRDERVGLNADMCWVDAWAFSRVGEIVERGDESVRRLGPRALDLYRGGFLPGADETSLIVITRLKLRDKLARLVSALGRQLEDAREFEQGLECYRRGIEADELAEEFYQGVMRCHAAMGRQAEGMAAYRRLRQTLSVVLGVRPSESSEQLMQLLGRAGSQRHS